MNLESCPDQSERVEETSDSEGRHHGVGDELLLVQHFPFYDGDHGSYPAATRSHCKLLWLQSFYKVVTLVLRKTFISITSELFHQKIFEKLIPFY